jgi:hypothetical protein
MYLLIKLTRELFLIILLFKRGIVVAVIVEPVIVVATVDVVVRFVGDDNGLVSPPNNS